MRLAEPAWLLLSPAVAWLVWRSRPRLAWADLGGVANAPRRPWRVRLHALPDLLRIAAGLTLVTALARPQTPISPDPASSEGLAMQVLVDVSGSMAAEDAGDGGAIVTRLAAVRPFVARLLGERPGDRVGVIAFAGTASVACPLTADHDAALAVLDRLEVDRLDNKTNLGDALVLALDVLRDVPAGRGRVVVCSDGAHNVPDGVDVGTAARMAEALGVPVHTVRFGRGDQPAAQETLERLAGRTGGRATCGEDVASLRAAADALSAADPGPQVAPSPAGWRDRGRWPLAAGAVGLLAAAVWYGQWWRAPPPSSFRRSLISHGGRTLQ